MSNPNNNKQQVILNSVKNNINGIDQIGKKCNRKRKRSKIDDDDDNDGSKNFLANFKDLLIYEAICSFMYYYDIKDGKKYLSNYSPRLYENSEAKKYISLINFLHFFF